MSVTARDAESSLSRLLAEARQYADEIVVGVDHASVDGTWDIARAGADRVFAFTHTGITSPARMAGLERASGDWILFLDDDEGMDAAFPALREELLNAHSITHWWLPRKWLDTWDPPAFLRADPWWPDYSLRLARADPTRVWKPVHLHSGLRVMGRGGRDARTAILHYERLDRDEAARAAKLARYRARGQQADGDRFYAPGPEVLRAPVEPPPLRGAGTAAAPRGRAVVDAAIDDLDLRPDKPGWGAEVTVDMPASARPGEVLIAAARARNTGTLRWDSPMGGIWPALSLTYIARRPDGTIVPDPAERTPVGRDVAPGETEEFLCRLHAPQEPGSYTLAWQLVSEHEYWFSQLGSPPALCPLTVA